MKYIRTTDGRITCWENNLGNDLETIGLFTIGGKENILKIADTIEELCDEFVAYHKTLKLTYCIKPTPFEKQDENFNIYGAIWTDKGLIYVAKTNEKGELELL